MTVVLHLEAGLVDVSGEGFEYDFSSLLISNIPYIWLEDGKWQYPLAEQIHYIDWTAYDKILIENKSKILALKSINTFDFYKGDYSDGMSMEDFLTIRRQKYQDEAIGCIFDKFTVSLSAIAIDKKGSRAYVESQTKVYETMYQSALDGVYEQPKNDAIIAKNKAGRQLIAPILDAMNTARAFLFAANESGAILGDLLKELEQAKLTKEMIVNGTAVTYLESLSLRIGGTA